MKVCATAGCPTLVQAGYCAKHRRDLERQRGTRQQRGYDAAYDRERRQAAAVLASGRTILCWRCRGPLTSDFDLGHCDDNRSVVHGPEHPHENRGARGPCPHPSHN